MFSTIFWLFYFTCGGLTVYLTYVSMCSTKEVIRNGEELFGYCVVALIEFIFGWVSLATLLTYFTVKRLKERNGGYLFKFGGK